MFPTMLIHTFASDPASVLNAATVAAITVLKLGGNAAAAAPASPIRGGAAAEVDLLVAATDCAKANAHQYGIICIPCAVEAVGGNSDGAMLLLALEIEATGASA
jgi:predicted nicotinamide N-methyase